MLEGEFTLRLGPEGEEVRVPAGTLARVPPMVVHGFRNGSDAELRFLNFHAPGVGFADYMRDLRDGRPAAYDQHDPPEDGGPHPGDAVIGEWADEPAIKIHEDAQRARDAPAVAHGRRATSSSTCSRARSWCAPSGEELRAQTGAWVHVPPQVGHAIRRSGRASAVLGRAHAGGEAGRTATAAG